MAKKGHEIIAAAQISPQVMPLRDEANALGLNNLRVERLDLTDPYDIAQAQSWDIDVLWNNAGMGEAGPVWEIPIDLVHKNYEDNVFQPLVLTQGIVRRWVSEGRYRFIAGASESCATSGSHQSADRCENPFGRSAGIAEVQAL